MNWPAALFAAAIWTIVAAIWIMFRPVRDDSNYRSVAIRATQDLMPAVLIGLLIGRLF